MSPSRRTSMRILIVVIALALVLAACGSSSKKSGSSGGGGNAAAPTGSLTVGAEQWPSCINPLTQCANSSWLQWLVPIHVLPRLTELDTKNNFVASPLLTEMPSTSNGGVTGSGNTFTVTYKLNPDAKWDDGTAITSADVAFTWHAYLDTTGSLSTTGYDQITSIDTSDPHTAVLHWKRTYADWQDVLGGFSGVILEKSKFTSTNLGKQMNTTIGFSGGPWILTSFSATKEVLTANTKYWDKDRIPKLQTITFIPLPDTSKEVAAVKSGAVAAVYPQPSADNVPQLPTGGNLNSTFGVTTQYESLWFNEKAGSPFADKNVRAGFTYAFDRQLFLNDIVKPFDPTVEMNNCAAWIKGVGPWCSDPGPWSDVSADAAKVTQFMTAAGYTKDGSGMWAKNGSQLTIKWMVNTGNQRRQDTQTEFIPLLKKQGFNVVTDNSDADTVFQKRLPAGDFQLGMYIQVASPDPSVTSILSTGQIPGPANKGQGQNDVWYSNTAADALMTKSDGQLDTQSRNTSIQSLDKILRADYVNLPLYAFPSMFTYRTDLVGGPVNDYINSPESNLWNIWAWTKA